MSDEFDEDDSAGDNTSDESSSSEVLDENDPMVWKSRYEKSKNKFAQATVTIQSLIEQFTEYKETVEDEKNQVCSGFVCTFLARFVPSGLRLFVSCSWKKSSQLRSRPL